MTKNDSKISVPLARLRNMEELSKKTVTVSVEKGKYTYFSHLTYDEWSEGTGEVLPKLSRIYFDKEKGIRHQNLIKRDGSKKNDDLK